MVWFYSQANLRYATADPEKVLLTLNAVKIDQKMFGYLLLPSFSINSAIRTVSIIILL